MVVNACFNFIKNKIQPRGQCFAKNGWLLFLYGCMLAVPMVIGAWWNPSINDLVANWMGQSVGWLVVWMVVLLLLKCRTRRPREAEVSCLFRDGSGRNSSMRCGENTPRERGCKKQQLSTLSIKVFTCIYSDSESLHHSSSIYNKRYHPLHKLIYTAFMFPQRHSSVWGEYRGRNGENRTFLPEDSPEYGWITQDYTLGKYSERKELLLLNSFFAHLEVKLHGPIKRQNV